LDFIIRIYHDTRSSECQIVQELSLVLWYVYNIKRRLCQVIPRKENINFCLCYRVTFFHVVICNMESNSVFISRYHRKPKFISFVLITVKNDVRNVLHAKFCRSSREFVAWQLHHFSLLCQRTTSVPCNPTGSPTILNCWNSRGNATVDNRTYVYTPFVT
jgi:hypothetical protein